ncbi:hypothetical protein G5I_11560 [Acromyrmex echinatior]|uniref:Uncharacterized protein n=1 Tax=Acromyrmex echinatior TaxID=103372 RepID=F4WZY3_ACREC|nr:hypothetical protein G5I_11560 [Acromyrmex echinatior]
MGEHKRFVRVAYSKLTQRVLGSQTNVQSNQTRVMITAAKKEIPQLSVNQPVQTSPMTRIDLIGDVYSTTEANGDTNSTII